VVVIEAPRQLDISTDILGYPTFANFDYTRTFTAYHFILYAVPGLTALGYLVLARWGTTLPAGSARTACSWGDTPNFYRPTPAGSRVDLPVQRISSDAVLTMSGWAADPATTTPARLVVLASGNTVLSASPPSATRSDVAQSLGQGALHSGFEITAPSPGEADSTDVLALTSDGKLHPLGGERPAAKRPRSLRLPDGHTAAVSAIPALGAVDDVKRTNPSTHLGVVAVPPGVRLADFQLATFDSGDGASIGPSDVWLADDLSNSTHRITAHALRRAGSNIVIRVGRCPQWLGYVGQSLYVSQGGGTPIARLELSGVG
jgi:hypothetical protein